MSKTNITTLENGTTIEVVKSGNTVTVEASVPTRVLAIQKKVTCTLNAIVDALREENVVLGALLESTGTTISNSKRGFEPNGRWVFETPTTKTARTNSRAKTKKTNTNKKTTKVPVTGTDKLLRTEDME